MKQKPIDPSSPREAVALHPQPPEVTADFQHQRTLDLSGQHSRFMAEHEQRKLRGLPGHCRGCGKPDPRCMLLCRRRRCTACRAARPWPWINTVPPVGAHIPSTRPQTPDLDGVTRYTMEGGVMELRPDCNARWVPAV